MQNKTSETRLAARRRLGSISARTSRLQIDLWFEHWAAKRAEQIALTCAARQKITFKKWTICSWAAAFTRPQSVDWTSCQSSAPLTSKFISFSSFNWDLYWLRPAGGGATCEMLNAIRVFAAVFRDDVTTPFYQRVFVVVTFFVFLVFFSFWSNHLLFFSFCSWRTFDATTFLTVFLFLWLLHLNKIRKWLTSVAYK